MDGFVNENTVVEFLDVLIRRFNDLETKLDLVLDYTKNDARYKTEHEIDGSIFGFPFTIKNYGFDKKSLAHVQIGFKTENNNMHKIYLSNWQNFDGMPTKYKPVAEKLKDMTQHLLGKHYDSFCENMKNPENIAMALSVTSYDPDIDTKQYDMISEYVINAYITGESVRNIMDYNQVALLANMFYVSGPEVFIDELIQDVLDRLAPYGVSPKEIDYIQVTGISPLMRRLMRFYNKLGGCFDNEERRYLVADMIGELCSCARHSLKMELIYNMRHRKSLPIFQEEEEFDFVMGLIKDVETSDDES